MASGKKIGLVIALDGEEKFKKAIKECKSEVKLYQTEIKNLSKEFKDNQNSAEALQRKHESLTKQQEAFRKQVDAAKTGLQNAKSEYQKQADAVRDLSQRLEAAEREQRRMADAGDTTSDAYKEQTREVDNLREALDKQTGNLAEAQTRVNNWSREVNTAETALKDCDRELKLNDQYLDEASKSADGCATSIDKYGNKVEDATADQNKFNISIGDMVKNKMIDLAGDALRELGQKAIEAARYVIEVGSSFEAQMSKVQSISGATEEEMDKLTAKAAEMGRTTKFTATEAGEGLTLRYTTYSGPAA